MRLPPPRGGRRAPAARPAGWRAPTAASPRRRTAPRGRARRVQRLAGRRASPQRPAGSWAAAAELRRSDPAAWAATGTADAARTSSADAETRWSRSNQGRQCGRSIHHQYTGRRAMIRVRVRPALRDLPVRPRRHRDRLHPSDHGGVPPHDADASRGGAGRGPLARRLRPPAPAATRQFRARCKPGGADGRHIPGLHRPAPRPAAAAVPGH